MLRFYRCPLGEMLEGIGVAVVGGGGGGGGGRTRVGLILGLDLHLDGRREVQRF